MVTAGELYRLARLLRDVALAVTTDSGESPAPLGLVTITDDIAQHEGTSVGEVAARTGLAQSLVSKTVAQLRHAGVVETAPDVRDRRRTRITVTDTARTEIFTDRGSRDITTALRQRFPELSNERISAIESLLAQLGAELDAPSRQPP